MKKYFVKCWIPVEDMKENSYDTLAEAEADKEQGELIQPENIYKIEEIELAHQKDEK